MKVVFINKKVVIRFVLYIYLVLSATYFLKQTYIFFTSNLQSNSLESRFENQKIFIRENTCHQTKHNLLFLKIHKTGSSSVQNLFFRYGDEHNLTFVLPKRFNYFGHPEKFNRSMFYSRSMFAQHSEILSSIQNNIFANHARYNYEELKSIMPLNTIFVTLLKEPVSVIQSVFSYYDFREICRGKSLESCLEIVFSTSSNKSIHHISTANRIHRRFGRNQMSFDLGLDVEHFDNLEMVREFIQTIDSQFHLVMIADRMEESLIHLQHLLCWTLNDVVIFQHNVQNENRSQTLSNALKGKIRFFNKADELLYKHFSDKLTRQTTAFGKNEMKKQIASLRHATNVMYHKCVENKVPIKKLELSKLIWSHQKILGFQLRDNTDEKCLRLTLPELLYMDLLREKQALQYGIHGFTVNRTNIQIQIK